MADPTPAQILGWRAAAAQGRPPPFGTTKPPECGTPEGYRAHLRRKQETCPRCRKAENDRQAARRAGGG